MLSNYLIHTDKEKMVQHFSANQFESVYDLLTEPLHLELYKYGSFEFLDQLNPIQQLILTYDYLLIQVSQGGFIQFIHNGYIGLVPDIMIQLQNLKDNSMVQLLDDVLKVFVLNKDLFLKATTLQDFTNLYQELKEFEILDERFKMLHLSTIELLICYIMNHLDSIVA